MKRRVNVRYALFLAVLGGLATLTGLGAKDPEPGKEPAKPDAGKAEAPPKATPVKPKPISENVKKGLAYLIQHQDASGGWGQGGGWRTNVQQRGGGGRIEGPNVKDPPDLANTCIATLALLRAGHTPREGQYKQNVAKAVEFICDHIEKADKDSLFVTPIRGTQVQSKIGPYVDTFLAALVMAELKGKGADDNSEKRLLAALDKTIGKMEKHQKADGSFAGNDGWASILSQGLASKSFNRAGQAGVMVSEQTLARDQKQSATGLDKDKGEFKPAAGAPSDAGVQIYNFSGRTAALQESVNTLKANEKKNQDTLKSATASKEQKDKAKAELNRLEEAEQAQTAATRGLTARLNDKQFIAGFGSNGGEEFLSFMNISETLLCKGGKDWQAWDKAVTENLNRIQDKDGGWSGHHCITGRTFCTASALLVLLADRAPIPAVVKAPEKKK